eukprot:7379981-Prymnesium_polylepis.1
MSRHSLHDRCVMRRHSYHRDVLRLLRGVFGSLHVFSSARNICYDTLCTVRARVPFVRVKSI